MKLAPLLEAPEGSWRQHQLHVQQLLLDAKLNYKVQVTDVDLLPNGWLIKAARDKFKLKFKVTKGKHHDQLTVTQHLAKGDYIRKAVPLAVGAEAEAWSIVKVVNQLIQEHSMQGGFDLS